MQQGPLLGVGGEVVPLAQCVVDVGKEEQGGKGRYRELLEVVGQHHHEGGGGRARQHEQVGRQDPLDASAVELAPGKPALRHFLEQDGGEIGRASCRERV